MFEERLEFDAAPELLVFDNPRGAALPEFGDEEVLVSGGTL
jgi:hypothetical protein